MARRRTAPPSTPFGAWLADWLADNPEWTHQHFADEVGVSKGLISQWVSGAVRNVTATNLAGVSRVTHEPLENLEQLVYGSKMPRGVAESPGRYFTDVELKALVSDAVHEGVQAALVELGLARDVKAH